MKFLSIDDPKIWLAKIGSFFHLQILSNWFKIKNPNWTGKINKFIMINTNILRPANDRRDGP